MTKFFIPYAHEDQVFVAKIAKELEQFDHTVFFAGSSIAPGEKFQETISVELRNADVIVSIVSQHSISSRWVMTEMGIALGYWEERGKPLIIPVVVDNVSIPPQFLKIQSIMRTRAELDEIVLDIASAIDKWLGQSQAKQDEQSEIQNRVEENAARYIRDSLGRLQTQEKRYRRAAYFWYALAFVALLGGVVYGVVRAIKYMPSDANWVVLIQFMTISVIVIGLLIALCRFLFILGKSFMVESLRNSDRIHAISFGEFYLNAFGVKADWQEVKDAFQHWNIDKGSDFLNQNPKDFDPEILKMLSDIVTKLNPKAK